MRRAFVATLVVAVAVLLCAASARAQRADEPDGLAWSDFELSAGFANMVYQSVFSLQGHIAFEAALRGPLSGLWRWEAGARVSVDRGLPEAYLRLLAVPAIASWRPSIGIEAGASRRTAFGDGAKLLREARNSMHGDISPYYVACHAAPLCFRAWDNWRISTVELQVGTHLGDPGRTTRFHIGLISLGRTL